MTKLICIQTHGIQLKLSHYVGKVQHEVAILDIQESDTTASVVAFIEEMRLYGLPTHLPNETITS